MANAERTCSIFVGVGDTKMNQFRGIEYSHEYLNIYDDWNFPPYPVRCVYSPFLKWEIDRT